MDDVPLRQRLAENPPARRERLAIIATGDRLCGIAAYVAALERHLAAAFEVTVLPLDQYLLRGASRRLRRLGDAEIARICGALPGFDAVNIQLEHGTLGLRPRDIYRRFRAIAAAAPRLSVTFHTLLEPPDFPRAELLRALFGLRWGEAEKLWTEYRRGALLSARLARLLRRTQRTKRLSAIVHTPRNRRDATHLYGIARVYDHPLAFLSAAEAATIRARASRRDFAILDAVPEQAVLVGVFGFISPYKGFDAVIQALRHLPDDHHLLIFGGIHPNEIRRHPGLHPYLARLLDEAEIDTTLYDRLGANAPKLTVADVGALFAANPRDVSSRIHFMGALADREFLAGMASCDVVVFPYLEVGQSSSGPLSQAVELGCRVVASRTRAFLGFAEYHPEAIEFFDIGNHLELATRLRARRQYPPRDGAPDRTVATNQAVYIAASAAAANSETVPRVPAPAVRAR